MCACKYFKKDFQTLTLSEKKALYVQQIVLFFLEEVSAQAGLIFFLHLLYYLPKFTCITAVL